MKGDLKRAEMEALECVQEMAVLMSEEMSTTCQGQGVVRIQVRREEMLIKGRVSATSHENNKTPGKNEN
jgi:porphobilinogen deaminase